jgi:long-chain acyl-CoA synthetase
VTRTPTVQTEGPENLIAAFADSVRRRPNQPALRYCGTSLSFGRLDEISDALAAALFERHVARGDRVAAYLQNDPQFVVAALAAWKLGATLVAVNPMLRHKELRHVLTDSGAAVLLTLESLWRDVAREVVAETAVRYVVTTSERDLIDDDVPGTPSEAAADREDHVNDLLALLVGYAGRSVPSARLTHNDVAILTYTSGTTGAAKGAMNTHGNLLAAARTYRDTVGLTDDDVVLGVAPLFHITGLTAHLALGLLAGIPVILTHRFDTEVVLETIERERPTFTVLAITAYVALMAGDRERRRDLSSLHFTLSGGAPIAPALAEAWERHSGVPLVPVYGLTETTGPTHMVPIGARPPVDPESGALSVGRAVPHTTVKVVDEAGSTVAPGTAGELVIGGPQVVPGYWDNPSETQLAFVDGAVRTGDVGVVDADGWCYIVDRKKDLINASGYKVWPREVEDGLLTHPAVREAAVVGVPDSYRGESVKAFVSLQANASAGADELIAFCRERMAAYKYPRSVVILDELPKNASGKLLRRVLRDGGPAEG